MDSQNISSAASPDTMVALLADVPDDEREGPPLADWLGA